MSARCGTCGSSLYTNGTCPICDRVRRVLVRLFRVGGAS